MDEGARRIATMLAATIDERGGAHWCVTGGSTAIGIYRSLANAPLRDAVKWGAVHVWWGDDRYVPRGHPLSNVTSFDDILLGPAGVPIPADQLHPFRTSEAIGRSRSAAWCAAQLTGELRLAGLSAVGGWPVFDVLTLGMGGDGHVLSVFPDSPAFDSLELAVAVPAPTHIEPRVERVTLNPAIVTVAHRLVVVAVGPEKAAVLADVFGQVRAPARWPAQLARREGATWFLDRAAAARLQP